jgi:UDP-N-acetylglucosamine transferase subunit ALG13
MLAINLITSVITNVTVNVIINCGSWVMCKSANSLYYLYKYIRPGSLIKDKIIDNVKDGDGEYIVITKEEYNTLMKNHQKQI